MRDLKNKWEEVIDGVFLHGKSTPDLSYGLPEGQYTVVEAVDLIAAVIAQAKQDTVREVIEKVHECSDSYHCSCLHESIDQLREDYNIKDE